MSTRTGLLMVALLSLSLPGLAAPLTQTLPDSLSNCTVGCKGQVVEPTAMVEIETNSITPSEITLLEGETLHVVAHDGGHNLIQVDANYIASIPVEFCLTQIPPNLCNPQAQPWEGNLSFLNPGDYYFVCSDHDQSMRLHVEVLQDQIFLSGFEPENTPPTLIAESQS